MTDITATIQTKIADELATALLSSARARVATAQAEAAEAAGDDTAAADHEERMLSANSAASEARRRAELVIETAQACGVHIGDAVRIAAETEALDQPAGAGTTIRQAVAELDDQARTIRRGK